MRDAVRLRSEPRRYSHGATGVASIALERFNSDWWHGPIPSPDTVLEVSPVGHDRRYSVTVERVRALRPQRGG